MKIAVIGDEEFALGFKLAGVKKVFILDHTEREIWEALKKASSDPEVGIVILKEEDFDSLSKLEKREVEKIVLPIVFKVSEKEKKEELNRLIKRSLGVDLWSS